MAMIRIEVHKGSSETNSNLMRRFSKKVKQSGILKEAKKGRYWERPQSPFKKKKSALHRLKKLKERRRLEKLGKIRNAYFKKAR